MLLSQGKIPLVESVVTIGNAQSIITIAGNSSQTSFSFPFVANAASDISVSAIASNGGITLLPSTSYSLSINPAGPNQLWGVGGTVIYPLVGSPIATGTYLQIQRILPLVQGTSVQNQGDFYAQVTEQALDTLEMQIQQVAARSSQWRGVWITGVSYNYGDLVQDGINGNNTNNFYFCAIANTSSVWKIDLGNGDWTLSVQAAVPTGSLALVGDVGGSGGSPITTTLATVNANVGIFQNATVTVNAKGLVTGVSAGSAGSGSVTSVTYTGDGVVHSSTPSSAVTSAGTVAATLISHAKNTILAGPVSGSNAAPTFRALVSADLPAAISKGNTLTLNPYSIGTVTSGAHGLSAVPNSCLFNLTCLTGEGGFSAGDVVILGGSALGISSTDTVLTMAANATGAFMITSSLQVPQISRRDTAANFNITAANWKLTAIPIII